MAFWNWYPTLLREAEKPAHDPWKFKVEEIVSPLEAYFKHASWVFYESKLFLEKKITKIIGTQLNHRHITRFIHGNRQPLLLTHCGLGIHHYNGVIMGAITSQITNFTIVYSTVYSDPDQRKHQNSASLAFVQGIHRWPVNSPHKWPVTWKVFPFDDVIMMYW